VSLYNPYTGSGSIEADLRKELNDMFFGNDYEVPKAHRILFRKMRWTSDNKLIPCECVDSLTNEATTRCPTCKGEGYLWDEDWAWVRKVDIGSNMKKLVLKNQHLPGGVINIDTVVYYMEYTAFPKHYDRIVEMVHDIEGAPVKPYRRWKIHKPQAVVEHRSDIGRIEYYSVFVSQKDAIQLDEDGYMK